MAISDAPSTASVSPEATIARLERRLERERDARRQAEEISERGMRDLWLTNRELDKRVEERTENLADALARLRVASSARDRFLSIVSHEMRTPLNGVLGMLELLTQHLAGEQGERYLEAATESADRLFQLVTRLLDLVELDSGSFTTARTVVEVAALADVVRDRWQMDALRRGYLLTVMTHGDEECSIDEPRIVQILNELVDNALTHSLPGAVRIELRSSEDGFVASVTDSGPGIDPERIPELMRSDLAMLDDSTARTAQGLGLGLGICRRIAEAVGGSLELESDGVTNSTATIVMPTNIARSDQPHPLNVDSASANGQVDEL